MKSKNGKKKLLIISVAVVLVLCCVFGIVLFGSAETVSRELSVEECQIIVDNTLKSIIKPTATGAKNIFDKSEITVKSVETGNTKNLIIECDYKTYDIAEVIKNKKEALMTSVYKKYLENESKGISTNATRISIDIAIELGEYLDQAKQKTGTVTFEIFEVSEGEFVLYLEEQSVDLCTGGLITASNEISKINTVSLDGEIIDISKKNTLRTGIKQCLALTNYDSQRPDVGSPILRWWNDFCKEFKRNFVDKSQWRYLSDGLLMTLSITGLSAIIGIVIGFVVAIVRCTHQTTGKLKILNTIFSTYVTIMRGTPVMVQLLIVYFVFLLPAGVDKFPAAVLCFGLNSGAYVAEIVRGGIMAIDKGQMEAGRSLGFNYPSTMYHIIIPQAFKAVLPALANEFITLLKESSVAFYIGVADLTQGGLKIRSITYSNFMPLIAVALIYLIIVMILTKLVSLLERRLRKSDH